MRAWFLLCRQPTGENDHLLDLFSEAQGVIRVRVSPPVLTPDLLIEYQGSWQDGRDWPKLRGVEVVQRFGMNGESLVCALYLSELLLQLLPQGEPYPQIYQLYRQTLKALSDGEASEVWLRYFEIQLLERLGYGICWTHTASGEPVDAELFYQYESGLGLTLVDVGVSGASLLEVAAGQLNTPQTLVAARHILRQAINDILPRPLVSRELLIKG